MIAALINTIKIIFFWFFNLSLNILQLIAIALFGITAYTIIKYSKNPRPISKKKALIAGILALAGFVAFALITKISIREDIIGIVANFLPIDRRTDIAYHPPYLQYLIFGGVVLIGEVIGKKFFKSQEITGKPGHYEIKGSPLYLKLWLITFGLLQIGYLFNIAFVLKYAIPITFITTVSVCYMNYFIYKKLKKEEKKNG